MNEPSVRLRAASWMMGVASAGALLAMLASSLVTPTVLAIPRPVATRSAPSTHTSSSPATKAQKAYDAYLASLRKKWDAKHPTGVTIKQAKKLPHASFSATPLSAVGQRVTSRAVSPHTTSPVTTSNAMTPLGPQPLTYQGVATSGQVSGIATSATNAQDVWISSYDGGVWHSTDGGSTWTPMTDNLGVMSFNAIAVDPTDAQVVYAGAGNPFGFASTVGQGIYKTTDGGATWTDLGASAFGYDFITQIAIDPANTQIILATAYYFGSPGQGGLLRSTDGGSTWTQVLADTGNTGYTQSQVVNVVFDPAAPTTVFASLSNESGTSAATTVQGIYKSTDSGATWTLVPGSPSGPNIGVTTLAISQDGVHLYAAIADGCYSDSTCGALYNSSLYELNTTSNTWTPISLVGSALAANGELTYGWNIYNVIAVDPADSTGATVLLGSRDLYRTTNSGATWTDLSGPSTNGVAAEQNQAYYPSASSSNFYFATEGGIWQWTTAAVDDNVGLNITSMSSGAVGDVGAYSPLYANTLEPNLYGEAVYPAGSSGTAGWTDNLSISNVAVDWSNNANLYESISACANNTCTAYDAFVMRSTDASGTYGSDFTSIGPDATDWGGFQGVTISPSHPQTLFYGTTRVYKTTNSLAATPTWSLISPQLDTTSAGPATCTGPASSNCPFIISIEVSPTSDNTLVVTYSDQQTFVTTDGGASWHAAGSLCTSGCFSSSYFAISADDSSTIYQVADVYGGTGPTSGVWESTDAGRNWTYVSGSASIPGAYFTSIATSLSSPDLLVVTSDAGAFVSADAGASWQVVAGLPLTVTTQAFFSHDGSQLLLTTMGRGVWAAAMPHLTLSPQVVSLTTAPGASPANQSVTLGNSGQGALSWSTSGLPSWLSVSPSSGSIPAGGTQQVTLSFSTPSTTAQTYTTYLNFHDNADNPLTMLPVTVSSSLSKTWYFAEGYTGGSFTEYLTLANPNPTSAHVSVEYLLQNGSAPITKTYTVNPNARQTVNVNSELGIGVGVSMVVTSDQPVVAERPMYFTYNSGGLVVPGGTDVLGATTLGTKFDFGYLDTSANHQTYLTVLNQNSNAMTATVVYYPATGGTPITVAHSVPANARGTILVNSDVPAGSYSAQVNLSVAGLVERPMYLVDATTHDTGSADVIGVQAPATSWSFAEGFTGAGFSERYILSNPGATTANVTVTFQRTDGTTATATVALSAGQQQVVDANSVLGAGVSNSASVTSDQPILAERFMSFNYLGSIPGATDVMGATTIGEVYDFAEGFTGPGFSEYLTLQNPQSSVTQVTVAYLPQSGAAPTVQTYLLAPQSRYTIYTNQVMPSQSFSMEVLASAPIVAERPMYFAYGGSQTGGSDVLGYQP